MCPSIAVLAGGGDGGGGSGNGAGNGDGQNGGDGSGSGDGANGGGNGAGSCGTGTPGSCTGCGNSMSVGDPIDVGSGRVFTPTVVDVAFPGPLPLAFRRQYNSGCRKRDVGLGWGWCHSLAWSIEEHRDHLVVWDNKGNPTRFAIPEPGQAVLGPEGKLLARTPEGYALEFAGLWRLFVTSDRERESHRLSAVVDDNGNRIELRYDGAGLRQIRDSVGRLVDVRCDERGRILSLSAKNANARGQSVVFARFSYDDAGCLVAVADCEGHVTRFTYDEGHALTSLDRPGTDAIFHFEYDGTGRCVESWGAPKAGALAGLAPDAPELLADGTRRAKGWMHVRLTFGMEGDVEVVDSISVRRFKANARGLIEKGVSGTSVFTRTFDDDGNLVRYVDALGATYQYIRDPRGFVVQAIDPLGNVTRTVRDPQGRPLRVSDALGKIMEATYDGRGNVTSLTMAAGDRYAFEYDDRGLVTREHRPDGTTARFTYDTHGNLVELQGGDGAVYRWVYDPLGNVVSETDPDGAVTTHAWDDKRRPVSLTRPDGGRSFYGYDAFGNLTSLSDGSRTITARYSALGDVVEQTHADGTKWTYLYDREGRSTAIVNEKGERRETALDVNGVVRRITSFDGRVERFKVDAMERLIEHVDADGRRTRYERNPLGQIVPSNIPTDRPPPSPSTPVAS
jgi:YD repeat-containing protein